MLRRKRVPKTRKLLAIASAPLFGLATLAATALTAPGANATTYHELEWGTASGTCLAETGTQSGVYLSGCGTTNHSLYWAVPAEGGTGQIINEHSGLCLTANDANDVYLDTCGTNHVQLWSRFLYNGMYDRFTNGHVPGFLLVHSFQGVQTVTIGTSSSVVTEFWTAL
jgi:hypothetical protein